MYSIEGLVLNGGWHKLELISSDLKVPLELYLFLKLLRFNYMLVLHDTGNVGAP